MSAIAPATWSLDVGIPDWLEVPKAPFDAPSWRADVALVLELLEFVDSQLGETPVAAGSPLEASSGIDSLLEFSASLPHDHHVVAGLTIPGRWPLPVIVVVSAIGDEPQDLLEAAGARGGEPIELPVVDYLPDHLGDGIRVTRFDLDDGGAVWATVTCARRMDDTDTVLTWRTLDLELVPLFSSDLELLLAGVRIGGDR
jgi:hypothetical protein